MEMIVEKAYAKLNLTLGILYKRPDGYHSLESLMQTVDLFDTVTVEKSRDITVTSSGMLLPYRNTLRKAAELFGSITGHGARIHVVKRIPAQAGMGGGSADGAAVLRALNRLYAEYLTDSDLASLALKVGADVPFMLRGGMQKAEGIGEILTPLPYKKLTFLIAKPSKGISTGELYASLKLPLPKPDTAAAAAAVAEGRPDKLAPLLFNAMEKSAVSVLPEIGSLKRTMLSLGAEAALMTGSGSAVFGLFKDDRAAETAKSYLSCVVPYCEIAHSL